MVVFHKPHMAMDQYLLIPFLVVWTSIYQLFWCSPGVLLVFDPLPYFCHEQSWMFLGPFWLLGFGWNCRDRLQNQHSHSKRAYHLGYIKHHTNKSWRNGMIPRCWPLTVLCATTLRWNLAKKQFCCEHRGRLWLIAPAGSWQLYCCWSWNLIWSNFLRCSTVDIPYICHGRFMMLFYVFLPHQRGESSLICRSFCTHKESPSW